MVAGVVQLLPEVFDGQRVFAEQQVAGRLDLGRAALGDADQPRVGLDLGEDLAVGADLAGGQALA
jgi:hypothetical protein